MFWLLPLAGAAIGAMTNKKNPLQGALMGGALGATGGLLAPAATGAAGGAGLLGSAGTGAAAAGAAEGAALGSAAAQGTTTGLLSQLGAAAKTAAPYAGLAMQSGLLGGNEQPVQASPVSMGRAEPNPLPAMAQSFEQDMQNRRQLDEERKKRRYSLLGEM